MAWKMTNVQLKKGYVVASVGVVRPFSAGMGTKIAEGCILT